MKNFQRLALLTLVLTMGMITLGGVVHNTGSSLACPDWPLCYGQVLPPMEGAIAIEHSHRLLGTLIGLCCIGLAVMSQRFREKDAKLHKMSWLALGLVIFQGVLGGVTVLMRLSPIVSTLHLASSQIFMGLLLWIAMRSHRHLHPIQGASSEVTPKIRKALAWAFGILFTQMLLGAAIRHGGAGVACGLGPDAIWLCQSVEGGTIWPEEAPAQLHMLHRFFAIIATAAIIGGTLPFLKWVRRTAPHLKKLRLLVVSSHALVTLQIVLGLLTISTGIGVISVTLHLVTAMLLCFVLLSLNFIAANKIATGVET